MMTSQLTARHPVCSTLVDNLRQQPRAFQPAPLRIGIRVVFPDIAQSGRPQERIGHRVANHVRVGVPQQSERVLDPQPTQNQRPPLAQPMRVVPDPNPHVEKAPSSFEAPMPPGTLQASSENRSVFRES